MPTIHRRHTEFKPKRIEFYLNACRRSVEHKRRDFGTEYSPISNDEIYAIECKVAKEMGLYAEPTEAQAPQYSAMMTAYIQLHCGD